MATRPPLPPFTAETAAHKVRLAEDAWNSRDPHTVSLAYTPDSVWRNRDEFITGRAAIVEFLQRKWDRELDYALRQSQVALVIAARRFKTSDYAALLDQVAPGCPDLRETVLLGGPRRSRAGPAHDPRPWGTRSWAGEEG